LTGVVQMHPHRCSGLIGVAGGNGVEDGFVLEVGDLRPALLAGAMGTSGGNRVSHAVGIELKKFTKKTIAGSKRDALVKSEVVLDGRRAAAAVGRQQIQTAAHGG